MWTFCVLAHSTCCKKWPLPGVILHDVSVAVTVAVQPISELTMETTFTSLGFKLTNSGLKVPILLKSQNPFGYQKVTQVNWVLCGNKKGEQALFLS